MSFFQFKKHRRNFLKFLSIFLFFPSKAFPKFNTKLINKRIVKKNKFTWFLDFNDK